MNCGNFYDKAYITFVAFQYFKTNSKEPWTSTNHNKVQ